MSEEKTIEQIFAADMRKFEEKGFSPSELKDVRRFQEWLKPGLMAVFNDNNFVCYTCFNPEKECECPEEEEL
jgi:hypothetical protein